MNILTISNLNKSFKDNHVIKDLNLEIKENSIFGFIGKNGAGKTTTMKMILGLLKPDSGEIKVMDTLVTFGNNETNKYIGYLPDVPSFYTYMNAYEYLYLCGEALNIEKETLVNKINNLLELVGLKDNKTYIKGYSRGMKQRLGIAQALLGNPKLLICDEPTSALDPIGRKEILDILLSIKDQTTVIFSTHILSDIEKICTHAAFINDGKIVKMGSINEIKDIKTSDILVEVNDSNQIELLTTNFIRYNRNNNLLKFNNYEMVDLMKFIIDNNISINKIEKLEPSLESVFMEVTK